MPKINEWPIKNLLKGLNVGAVEDPHLVVPSRDGVLPPAQVTDVLVQVLYHLGSTL